VGQRRKARECALQILFELEFNTGDPRALVCQFWRQQKATEDIRAYAGWLVDRIIACRAEIDAAIQTASKNWRLARMGAVDRTILRVAVCELLYEPALAPAIIINEAIEIAKRYSGQDSATFVNGILDAVRKRREPAAGSRAGTTQEGHHEQDRGHSAQRTRSRAARRTGN
jgi:N utilization substance protein B